MMNRMTISRCPCCGSLNVTLKTTVHGGFIIECGNNACGNRTKEWTTTDEAINAWNKRPKELVSACRVGDFIYSIKDYGVSDKNDITTFIVDSIITFGDGKWLYHVKNNSLMLSEIIQSDEFGKTAFKTYDDADEAVTARKETK